MKISVIIPAYNAEKYLSETINSVLCQAVDTEKEIIVIDDGSSDSTIEVAKKNNAKCISIAHRGASAARNEGLNIATGDVVFFIDSDDVSCNGAIDLMIKSLTPETDMVTGLVEDFVSNELSEDERRKLVPKTAPYGGLFIGCSLIRRGVFEKVGVFDTSLKSGEVVDWLLRFRRSGLKSTSVEQTVLKRRLHMNNTGRINRMSEMQSYAEIIRRMRAGKNE